MTNVLAFPARQPAPPPAPAPDLPSADEMCAAKRAIHQAVAALGERDFLALSQRIHAALPVLTDCERDNNADARAGILRADALMLETAYHLVRVVQLASELQASIQEGRE